MLKIYKHTRNELIVAIGLEAIVLLFFQDFTVWHAREQIFRERSKWRPIVLRFVPTT
jgi:hypothetical protein